MEYISSDTNVWIDFLTIDKINLPFLLPYVFLMNSDAIGNELVEPEGLGERLIEHGLVPTELTTEEFFLAEELNMKEEYLSCLKKLQHYNGGKVRLLSRIIELMIEQLIE